MKKWLWLCLLIPFVPVPASACPERFSDLTNEACRSTLATTLAGEDVANDVLKVEQRFAPINVSADTLVKSGPGCLHLAGHGPFPLASLRLC
jgi:hypothetical protein